MRPATHQRFVDKAEAAMVAAVEIYNKPCFPYREEVFSILALNAWELLLKAAVLKANNNDIRSIRVYEPKKLKSGRPSKKLYLKKNRTGNYQTISLGVCLNELSSGKSKIAPEIKTNLHALVAIRDNSVHYVTPSSVLASQIQEIASGCVHNFLLIAKEWFSRDLTNSLSLVLPLSFAAGSVSEAIVVSPDENRIIKHLSALVSAEVKQPTDFAVALRLSLKMERSSTSSTKVQISKDQDALKVTLSEEDIREKYPWDYDRLCKHLRTRYSDFLANNHFHKLRKPLQTDERFCKPRLLDPGNPNGTRKDFYNPNIVAEFDKHYALKK